MKLSIPSYAIQANSQPLYYSEKEIDTGNIEGIYKTTCKDLWFIKMKAGFATSDTYTNIDSIVNIFVALKND